MKNFYTRRFVSKGALSLGLALAACSSTSGSNSGSTKRMPADEGSSEDSLTLEQKKALRQVALKNAQIYFDNDALQDVNVVARRDIEKGPPGALPYDIELSCTFKVAKLGGTTPKFHCHVKGAGTYKIKYIADKQGVSYPPAINLFKSSDGKAGEIFADPVATRLAWALGFASRQSYQIKSVRCLKCPLNPWKYSDTGATPPAEALQDEVVFQNVMIEDDYGKKLEAYEDEGWSFDELSKSSKVTPAQIDALKLFAVFVQHGDNKAANQKLICAEGQGGLRDCQSPYFFLSDLGSTFGKGAGWGPTTKLNFDVWNNKNIWKNPGRCVANMFVIGGTLSDPTISEAGRVFLLERLQQLSDAQITALFHQSQIALWDPDHNPASGDVSQWVRAFKRKVGEIASVRCPR